MLMIRRAQGRNRLIFSQLKILKKLVYSKIFLKKYYPISIILLMTLASMT